MQNYVRQRWLIAAITLVVALLTISTIVSISFVRRHEAFARWSSHSDLVIEYTEQALVAFVDAETAERGFLLEHERKFLEPYEQSLNSLDTTLAILLRMTADNSSQQEILHQVIELKTSLFEKYRLSIEAQKDNDLGRGKEMMDAIRALIQKMVVDETNLRNERHADEEKSLRSINLINISSVLISLLLLAFFLHLMRQNSIMAKEKEVQLIQEKDRALEVSELKSNFLTNMSHEIRTPMNGIVGMADLLRETELDPQQKKYVEIVRESSSTLLALINSILDLSKIESGKLEIESIPTDVSSLLHSVQSVFQYQTAQKGIDLVLTSDPKIPEFLMGDPLRIRQILTNLVNNAVKFTEGGRIEISATVLEQKSERFKLRFEIQDTGMGMSPDVIEKLFGHFSQADASTTRRYGGSGLGLAICKLLVENMHGEIGVNSVVGKGSTFWFELPFLISDQELIVSTTPAGKIEKFDREYEILMVEDNIINQKVIGSMLHKLGMKVTIANQGEEALAILRERDFDLIIMDCHMPIMDGYTATRHIRSDFSYPKNQIKILASTANAIQGDREKCIEAGMDDYVSKPVLLETLSHKLKFMLNGNAYAKASIRKALMELKRQSGSKSEFFLKNTIEFFEQESLQQIEKIEAAIAKDNAEEIRFTAHALRSSSVQLGAKDLVQCAAEIERLASFSEIDKVQHYFPQLKLERDRTIANMSEYKA